MAPYHLATGKSPSLYLPVSSISFSTHLHFIFLFSSSFQLKWDIFPASESLGTKKADYSSERCCLSADKKNDMMCQAQADLFPDDYRSYLQLLCLDIKVKCHDVISPVLFP
ncbi:hypothetical protein EJB05_55690 [Eragrostis curvula]|uniref:Uncharacterized protein n=1 Tax=Eragrostis curvula TaxID=38414 RepID=A0A5J9SJ14_9POAL|nr:hypothetical protein EJB05_55690 [Eragrostis curvula]